LKNLLLFFAAILASVTVPVRAGESVAYKRVVPPPTELYGTGFYGAIDLGSNLFQNHGDTTTFTERPDRFTTDIVKIHPDNDVGFFGGIKLGYVFGTGVIRPTVEGDFFYNGFARDAHFKVGEIIDVCGGTPGCLAPILFASRKGDVSTWINTGAFMGNFILRLALGRFQPYAGAGVGVYYAESAGADINTPTRVLSTGGGGNQADLAWQVLAGSDYYWNPKLSTFIEYRYLNYTSSQIETRDDFDLGQHLLGAGLRFHF
jgi:opacity protein-like surface antigen